MARRACDSGGWLSRKCIVMSVQLERLQVKGLQIPLAAEAATTAPALVTRDFLIVLFAQAGFGYSFSSFLLLPKYLRVEFAASAGQIGLVSAASGVAAMAALLACGVGVDRWGRRRFLTAGGVLMAACSLAFGAVDSSPDPGMRRPKMSVAPPVSPASPGTLRPKMSVDRDGASADGAIVRPKMSLRPVMRGVRRVKIS